jgi:hypothetical protein
MKTTRKLHMATLVLLAITTAHVPAIATVQMYGAEFQASGEFYSLNTMDGSFTRLGNTNDFLCSMDFSPSGTLYAASSSLKEVNPSSGIASNIRTINFVGGPGYDIITGLAFSTSNNLFGIGNGNGNLWRIDTVTANAYFVGSSGKPIFSLEFGPNGTLFGAGHDLWEISASDGEATLVGRIGGGALINALDFASDGVMYGASCNITTDALYTIDLTTGAGNRIGITGGDLVSIASIPEPATVALLWLGSMCLLRKRRR